MCFPSSSYFVHIKALMCKVGCGPVAGRGDALYGEKEFQSPLVMFPFAALIIQIANKRMLSVISIATI
jgi:hypothetical protein